MKKWLENPNNRKYLYMLAVALIPILVTLGFVTPDVVQLYLNLAAALLGIGTGSLAIPNTANTPAEQVTTSSIPVVVVEKHPDDVEDTDTVIDPDILENGPKHLG